MVDSNKPDGRKEENEERKQMGRTEMKKNKREEEPFIDGASYRKFYIALSSVPGKTIVISFSTVLSHILVQSHY